MEQRKPTIEERLYTNETRPDRSSHLEVRDPDRCGECARRECVAACPAGTYRWEADASRLVVQFENCLECSTCRLVCPHDNISWRYPMGGMGICYRYG